jgi:hypothetical protein
MWGKTHTVNGKGSSTHPSIVIGTSIVEVKFSFPLILVITPASSPVAELNGLVLNIDIRI